jgi:ABC-type sugar transport system ATPase subunit
MTGESITAAVPVLTGRHLTKRYDRLYALQDVSLDINRGEIVGLVGDNGAGKSTLAGILSGSIRATSGTVLIDGKEIGLSGPEDARRFGIETVFQDLALALDLSITDNIFLGREVHRRGLFSKLVGWLDQEAMNRRATEELERLGIAIPNPSRLCLTLSGGQRQAVAVGRAMAWGSRVVLMDEPTAALGVEEREKVDQLVMGLRKHGTPVLMITHNIPQVIELADRIIVLRQGRLVAELARDHTDLEEIVCYIVGSKGPGAGPAHLSSTTLEGL